MLELKSVDAGYGTFQALFGVSLALGAENASKPITSRTSMLRC